MEKELFDVLIVYSDKLATSAHTLKKEALSPFAKNSSHESYNLVYAYFLKICQKKKLKVAFTTSADITGPGQCSAYWLYQKNNWQKVRQTAFSKIIFDKFSPVNQKINKNRQLLFSSARIKPFNPAPLFNLFLDKQKTYRRLSSFSIPTVTIQKSTLKGVLSALAALQKLTAKHPSREDFSSEIVVKDRFGAGGIDVYKFKTNEVKKIVTLLKKHPQKSFIAQSFIKFDQGFLYQNSPVSTDIRLIHLNGKIIQTYIRMAKKGDFRCNEHQGGTLKYVSQDQIPTDIFLAFHKIIKIINKKSSLYALDFIISNHGHIYLLEGNTGPGLDWDLSRNENRLEAQKLIRIVVKKLIGMAHPSKPIKKILSPLVIDPLVIDAVSFKIS